MLSLFKRKPSEITFKTRVQHFWDWYAQVAPRFYQTIEAGQCEALATEVSSKVDELIPGFAWVFGPGEGGRGHSFTLSGEGNLHRQLLTQFWLSQAPGLTGWTFHASRQPGSIKGICIHIAERVFDPIEFWLTPFVDREEESVDLTVWHPLFPQLEEQERWRVLFLFLDEVLGEYGTQQWLGEIKLGDQRLADAIPLQELPAFVKKLEAETGWKKLPPGESRFVYERADRHGRFLRGDVITGSTTHPKIINEYLEAEGELADPLAGTGADYMFVSFDVNILAEGSESEARGATEEALDRALKSSASGRVLGGALGTENAYIDLLLFDGSSSLEIVQRVLRERNLPAGTTIHFFAKEKRGQRVVL